MKIKTCIPKILPLHSLNWESLVNLIGIAHATISRFDEALKGVEDSFPLFSMLMIQESLHSQKDNVTFEDVILNSSNHRSEIDKILNYNSALLYGAKRIKTHTISFDLMKKLHGMIKNDSSNQENGKFRDRQNWIGPENHPIEDAYFYPPEVKIMNQSMMNLKKYLHHKEKDLLIQLAIFFAQFLIIHPFMDGNGRVGRMLIPLFLYQKKLISAPLFYLSGYFKKHRLKYFENLYLITIENAWEEWIEFFLKGVIEEGKKNYTIVKSILNLSSEITQNLKEVVPIKFVKQIHDLLFKTPIFDSKTWDLNHLVTSKALNRLEEKKLIIPYKNKPIFVLKKLMTIID